MSPDTITIIATAIAAVLSYFAGKHKVVGKILNAVLEKLRGTRESEAV